MRFKDAQNMLRQRGITLTNTGYDYRVAFAGRGHEASACYDTDLEGAYDTGIHMANVRDADAT